MKHIIDTHALLWHFQGSTRLGLNAKAVLQDPASEIVFPTTAYGEALWILEHGRIPTLTIIDVKTAIDTDTRDARRQHH